MKSQCFKSLISPARSVGLGDMAEALLLSEAKLPSSTAGVLLSLGFFSSGTSISRLLFFWYESRGEHPMKHWCKSKE